MKKSWLKPIANSMKPIVKVVTSGNLTLTQTEGLVLVFSAEDTNITITLPKATNNKAIFQIFRLPGDSTTLTVDGNGTELIDEALTTVLTEDYEGVTLISNNPNVIEPNSTLSSSWKIDNLF